MVPTTGTAAAATPEANDIAKDNLVAMDQNDAMEQAAENKLVEFPSSSSSSSMPPEEDDGDNASHGSHRL